MNKALTAEQPLHNVKISHQVRQSSWEIANCPSIPNITSNTVTTLWETATAKEGWSSKAIHCQYINISLTGPNNYLSWAEQCREPTVLCNNFENSNTKKPYPQMTRRLTSSSTWCICQSVNWSKFWANFHEKLVIESYAISVQVKEMLPQEYLSSQRAKNHTQRNVHFKTK